MYGNDYQLWVSKRVRASFDEQWKAIYEMGPTTNGFSTPLTYSDTEKNAVFHYSTPFFLVLFYFIPWTT